MMRMEIESLKEILILQIMSGPMNIQILINMIIYLIPQEEPLSMVPPDQWRCQNEYNQRKFVE